MSLKLVIVVIGGVGIGRVMSKEVGSENVEKLIVWQAVDYRAPWRTFKPKLEKIRKMHPKNFLLFQEKTF